MKVKTFDAWAPARLGSAGFFAAELQKKINAFLDENPNIEVIDIKFTSVGTALNDSKGAIVGAAILI